MAERMFGLETEYAFSALGDEGDRISQQHGIRRLESLVREMQPHLHDSHANAVFFQNGSRFYIDSGAHPELCTPEVVNPWDACRYAIAGDRILTTAAEEVVRREPGIAQIILTRCNVCYTSSCSTWGSHESYGHQAEPSRMNAELQPHLVSRLIYTGAGGFNNRSAGIEFMVSPRVAHLCHATSEESTRQRGIVHTKDETLSTNGYHRLHLVCGESLCSQKSLWLRFGVTAIVVAMIEAKLKPCNAIQLRDPLEAMKRFAKDTTCTAVSETTTGRQVTALDMQRHLLEQAEKHQAHPAMPPWRAAVCDQWRIILDALDSGPAAVATELDWAIKLALYQEVARQRGFQWESLAEMGRELEPSPPESLHDSLMIELLQAARRAEQPKPARGKLRKVQETRDYLRVLDTRFSQLGEQGVFGCMDRAGVLNHHVPGVDNIEHAVNEPPAIGRAQLRGRWIRQLNSQEGCCCDWMGVWDGPRKRYLDLSEPFASDEVWKDRPRDVLPPHPRFRTPRAERSGSLASEYLHLAMSMYECGNYEEANHVFHEIESLQLGLPPTAQCEWLRLKCWVHARRGFPEAFSCLEQLAAGHARSLWLINDYLTVHRFYGLTPRPEMRQWVDIGREFLQTQAPRDVMAGAFHEHHGYLLMSEGALEEANDVLGTARNQLAEQGNTRLLDRAKAGAAEVYRRLGDTEQARRILAEVATSQRRHGLKGDLADFTLPTQAKLETDRDRALAILEEATTIQTHSHNRMGEAMTLLLTARLVQDATQSQRLRRRLQGLKRQIPALQECRLMASALERWQEWTSGDLQPDVVGLHFA